jgi:hypothetical protein
MSTLLLPSLGIARRTWLSSGTFWRVEVLRVYTDDVVTIAELASFGAET